MIAFPHVLRRAPDPVAETPAETGPPKFLVLFSDDSTLFFALRMREVLQAADRECEVALGWYLNETALSYRQLSQLLPEGPDLFLRDKELRRLAGQPDFAAIVTSRVYRPLGDVLKRPLFRYYRHRPCVIAFLGGLEFHPERGFNHRRNCDSVFVFPRKSVADFAAASQSWDSGWQDVGFGHPSFLRPEPVERPSDVRDIYFFAQAISPRTRRGRMHVLEVLAALAERHSDRTVWIKLRHLPHENAAHLHKEKHDYPGLLNAMKDAPENLRLTACTMDEALDSAALGITCTSTAAVDLVRSGVPAMVYLDYVDNYADPLVGPMRAQFAESGLIADLQQVLALKPSPVNPEWLADMFCPRDLGNRVMDTLERFTDRPFQIDQLP